MQPRESHLMLHDGGLKDAGIQFPARQLLSILPRHAATRL